MAELDELLHDYLSHCRRFRSSREPTLELRWIAAVEHARRVEALQLGHVLTNRGCPRDNA